MLTPTLTPVRFGNSSSVGAPTISSTISSTSQALEWWVPWTDAVTKHGQPVRKATHLLQAVAHVDDRRSLIARLLDEVLEMSREPHVERRSRLVQQQNLGLVTHGPRHFQ